MCGIMEENMRRDTNFERHREVTTMASIENETYTKLELQDGENSQETQILFVKGTWYPTHFWLSVLDGRDTWTFNASMEFVAHEASEWGMRVEEWLDKIQMHLSHQHSENSYAFINVGDNTKMLQCSIYNEVRHERRVVRLLLDKTAKCGQVAFEILGLLVETNSKQNEELARKTRDIQQMAAEIRELRHNFDEHIKMEHNTSTGMYYHTGMAHEPTHNLKESAIQSTWPISRVTSLSKNLSVGYCVEEVGHVDESLIQHLARDDSWENIQNLANKSAYHKDDRLYLEPQIGRQYSGHTRDSQQDQISTTISHSGFHQSVALNREPSSKINNVPSRPNSRSNSRRTSWNALEALAQQSSTPSWSLTSASNNKTQPKQAMFLIIGGRNIDEVTSEHNDMEYKSLSSANHSKNNPYVPAQQKMIEDSPKSTTFGEEREFQSRLSNTSISQSMGENWSLEPLVLDNEYQTREASYLNFDGQGSREEDISVDDNYQSRHSHTSTRQSTESRVSQKNMQLSVKNDKQDSGEETSQDHTRQNGGKSQGISSRAQSHTKLDPSKPNYTDTQAKFNSTHQDLCSSTNSTRISFAPQQLAGSHISKSSYARPQSQEKLEMPIHEIKFSYHEPAPESMIVEPQQVSTQLKIVLKSNNKKLMTSSYNLKQKNSSIVDANYITTSPDINNDKSISYQELEHSMTNQALHEGENDQENMGIPILNIEDREDQITTGRPYTEFSKNQLQGNVSRPQSHSEHPPSTIYHNELPIRITHLRWGVNSTSDPRWKEPSGPPEIVGVLRSSTSSYANPSNQNSSFAKEEQRISHIPPQKVRSESTNALDISTLDGERINIDPSIHSTQTPTRQSGVDQEFQEHHEMVRFSMHDTKQKETEPESHRWYSGHSRGHNQGGASKMQSHVDNPQSILHQGDAPSRISHVTWGRNHVQVKGSREVSILDTQTSRPFESRTLSTFGSRNSSQTSHNMTTSNRRQTAFDRNSHVEQTMNDATHETHERSESSSSTIPLEQIVIDKENALQPSTQGKETNSNPSSISEALQSFTENLGMISPKVEEQKESKDATLATTEDEIKNYQDSTNYSEQQSSYSGPQQSISHTTQTMNQVNDDEKSSSLFSTYYEPHKSIVVPPTQQDSRIKSARPSYTTDDNSTIKQSVESVSEPSTSSIFSKLSFNPFAQKSMSTKAPIPTEVEDELRRELHRTLGRPSQSTSIGPTNTHDETIGSRRTSLIRLDNGEVVDQIAYKKALKDNEQGVKSKQTSSSKLEEPDQLRPSTYKSTLQSFAKNWGLISPKVDNVIEQQEFIHTNAEDEANKPPNTILPIDQQSYEGSPAEKPKEGHGSAMILSRMSPWSWKRGETQRRYSVDNMKQKVEIQKRYSQKTLPRSYTSISRQSIQFKDNEMINKPSFSTSSRSPGIATSNTNYNGALQSTRTSQASPRNQQSISYGEDNETNTQVVSNNQDDGQGVASSSRRSSFDIHEKNSLKEREVEDPHNFEYNVYDERKLTPYPMSSLTTMSSSRMSSLAKRSMNKEFDQTSVACDEDTIQCTANIRFLIPKNSSSSLVEHGQPASHMSRGDSPQVDSLGLWPPAEEPWCPYCKGPKEDQNVGQKISLGLRFTGKGRQGQQRQVTKGG